MFQYALLIFSLLFASVLRASVTLDEAKGASEVIGRWFSKTTGHYDFQSATPIATKRAGTKFMIVVAPDVQNASDYGYSFMLAPRDSAVTKAYETLGLSTSSMGKNLELNRFHLNFGFANKYDFSFSYLSTLDLRLTGWGVGFKTIVQQMGPFFFSYRIQYASSKREDFFSSQSLTNDFSLSLYLRLLDVYAGVRHGVGKVNFISSVPELQLPSVKYISHLDQLEYFYGATAALTTNSRLTFQCLKIGEEMAYAAKLSLHFDSLLPTDGDWFRDPRYIKQ